ncbi:hypothetical protein [Streptomyces sp. B27]|uniref:hypothetical protein n=1 Tax=Streptomyces sp. B27 TaxID=2485015 RepID=UPI000FDAE27E|nr:hypothetical protein [Streptomyces sp. B27]
METFEMVATAAQRSHVAKWTNSIDAPTKINDKWIYGVLISVNTRKKGGDLMASRRKGNNKAHRAREERRFTVRGIRRDPPDIRKLAKALIGLAMAEAEREAQAEQAARQTKAQTSSADTEVR